LDLVCSISCFILSCRPHEPIKGSLHNIFQCKIIIFFYLYVISPVRILPAIQIMTKYWLVVWNTCILIIVRTTIYTVYVIYIRYL
jgi:hypothetical protein